MSAYEITVIAGMFAVTFGTRYILLAFSSRLRISEQVTRILEFVPPAVLTAIIVPGVLMPEGSRVDLSLTNAYLPAAGAAILCQILSKNLLVTIVTGIAVFFLWNFLVSPQLIMH